MYNICRIVRAYGIPFEYVYRMEFIEFKKIQKQLDVIEAEERFILQRQLDNHIKLKSKQLIQHFGDIYKEFEDIIYSEIKIIKKEPPKISKETAKALWQNTLSKLKK